MPTLRTQPYIWTTWITKFLAGDNSCEWATWYKAHHEVPSRSKGNMDEWRIMNQAVTTQENMNSTHNGSAKQDDQILDDKNDWARKMLPPFNPSWPEKRQDEWFQAFNKLLGK